MGCVLEVDNAPHSSQPSWQGIDRIGIAVSRITDVLGAWNVFRPSFILTSPRVPVARAAKPPRKPRTLLHFYSLHLYLIPFRLRSIVPRIVVRLF